MRVTKTYTLAPLIFLALVLFTGQAFSTTVAVGSCTSLVNFATISQAVAAVPAGSTIEICPGNYHEQVVINQKLTLRGIMYAGKNAAVVYPPAGGLLANTSDARGAVAAQILVQG